MDLVARSLVSFGRAALAASAVTLLGAGCSFDAPEPATPCEDSAEPMPDPAVPHPSIVRPAAPVALMTDDGSLALVSAADGSEIARTALGTTGDVDLAFDRSSASLVAFVAGEDEGGEVRRFALSSDRRALGPPTKLGWIDGTARLLPVPAGLVVFEENVGARWKLLGAGAAVPSVGCPRPSSIAATDAGPHTRLVGLATVDGDAWSHVSARVDDQGFDGCAEVPLLGFGLASAHLVVLPDGREIALGIAAGEAAFRGFPLVAAEPSKLAVGATGVGAAIPLRVADQDLVALLASGPSMLAVFDPSAPPSSAKTIALPGDVRLDDRSLSRDLAAVASPTCAPPTPTPTAVTATSRSCGAPAVRVLAATSAGVFAVDVAFTVGGIELTAAPFAGAPLAPNGWRGPIAVTDDSP